VVYEFVGQLRWQALIEQNTHGLPALRVPARVPRWPARD
jgi:hypothetical protein